MFAFHGHIWCIQRQRFTTTTSLDSCHVTSTSREVNQSNGVKFFSKSGSYEHMHDPWCVRSLCRFLRFMSHSGSHFPKPRGRGCRCRVCRYMKECVVFSFPIAHNISMQHEVDSDLIMRLWLILCYKLTRFQNQRIPRLFLACEINPHVMQCCWS